MQINVKGLNIIKKYEGFRPEPYYCPANVLTIGYGHAIKPDEVETLKKVSLEEAGNLLLEDISITERTIEKLVTIDLTENEFSALVSFCYNVGGGNFKSSTMLKLINNDQKLEASLEFNRWVYVNKKIMKGLIRRRLEECQLFLG